MPWLAQRISIEHVLLKPNYLYLAIPLNSQTYKCMKKTLLITLLSVATYLGVSASICYVDTTINIGICAGQSYSFNDSVFTATGTHYDTLAASGGCDSVIILNLTVYPVYRDTTNKTICSGQTFGGHNTAGVFSDTLTSVNGCDSILVLNLTVNPVVTTTISPSICQGQSFSGHSSTGVYLDTLTSSGGCDSIVTINLTVNPVPQTTINLNLCNGDTYVFNDTLRTITGTYTVVYSANDACDSIVTLNLTILPNPIQPYITQQGDSLISGDLNGNQWYLNDSVLVGDTSNILVVPRDGSYQVRVTGPNSCSNISAAYVYYAAGINIVESAFNVSVYPNPSNGNFVAEFGDNNMKEVSFIDMLGQTVVPVRQISGKYEFNLSGLANGVYLMRMADTQDGKVVFKQVVVQH